MAVPTYATDLQSFGSNVTTTSGWTEPSGFTNTNGAGEVDTDLSIYGSSCYTEAMRKSGKGGLFYTTTEPGDFSDGTDCIFAWFKWFAPNATISKATGGIQMFVGSTSSNFNQYYMDGSDTYPYGGWVNYVVNPNTTAVSASTSTGSPNGTHNGVGLGVDITYAIAKGNALNIDIIRYGRGELSVIDGQAGSYGVFSGMASANDNPTTGRWGLFADQGGSYLWKGLMTLGNATSVDFRDSNVTITVDDTEFVQSAFNRIEINNTSSNIEWTSITISSLSTVSRGEFEVVDNATVSIDSCTFNDMSTFVFNDGTNANTVLDTTFRRCELVTQGGANFNGCTFENSAAASAFLVDDISVVGSSKPNSFIGDGTTTPGHAVDLGTINTGGAVTYNWYNELDNGTTNQNVWEGSTQSPTAGTQGTANSAITVNVASGTSLKISVASGATIPTVQNTGTGTVEITANEVTLTITVQDITDQSVIEGAMVYCTDSGETTTYIDKVETNASGQVSFTGSLGSAQVLAGNVRAATPDLKAYTKYYKAAPIVGTFSNIQNTDITISLIPDE